MFDIFDPERSSTWQLEHHQLRLANKKLKEELEKYEAKTKPKTKKHCMDNNVEHIRARCLRKKSPEW
jgi:glycerol dehydrogenase-like iron-containing ADH family enzyme